ncbi:MAG TPA: protein ndvB, partial [Anaerolineales bacterium]
VAFLAASKKLHGLTADRVEFIGRNGTLDFPVALRRIGPEVRVTPGEDPCAVLQVHIDLPPGAVEEVYFLIGEGDQRQHALDLIECYHDPQAVQAAWQETQAFWDKTLSAVQVQTPDPAIDLMVNRWLLYQTLSCRIWGRTAFYQSSGAYGFRDQLQDVMALLPTRPEITREQILKAAAHQFEAGDVLHWWHPPSGRGVRTRISDDLLFLPFVVSEYLLATGDTGLLDEKVPFLQAPPLAVGEDERYGFYSPTSAGYSILDHCRRAIEKGSTQGPNGLPLIGTGDWNDGLNRVGIEGKGESIWLGWFLCDVLERFANIEAELGNQQASAALKDRAAVYARSIEEHAWDGRWYRRAYYDDGAPLGSEANRECKIDTIAQSWAIISRAGDPDRSRQAIESVREMLVQPDNRLLLLFTPPFDTTPRDPGYIKAYVPGIRENGGQYTHASIWAAWAYAQLGEGDQAAELLALLNPIYQADQQEKVEIYKTEPYVVAADIYSTPPHVRRGGWTWYTGSSGWLYRTMVEATLGLQRRGNFLVIDPVIPAGWDT